MYLIQSSWLSLYELMLPITLDGLLGAGDHRRIESKKKSAGGYDEGPGVDISTGHMANSFIVCPNVSPAAPVSLSLLLQRL